MERHPNLKEKLQLLYLLQLNPHITSNSDLGAEIGKSRQAISRWCLGTETSRGNAIPLEELSKVARAFRIEPEWFSLSLEDFEHEVRKNLKETKSISQGAGVKISTSTLPITNVKIFGRERELKLLSDYWFDMRTNVVEVTAFGGAGKSSLVNKWLSELSKSRYKGASRIYAWSFYWQNHANDVDSSGDYFVEHALDWFGDPCPYKGTPWSKATRLANLIREHKTLLILDGLELLQL
ncbi:MAG: helix-turn-helix domain-containing protein, partial [Pseudomonadales bacterium]|nr:helix-turn-helix domain-containing protein [Pseudomonadales bacterium]